MNNPGPPSSVTVALIVAITAAAAVIYVAAISPARFGLYHDDSLYVVTAKAIAAGEGYRIISLPQAPLETKYPPLYPAVLSLVWVVSPQFPQNLMPMFYLSVGLATLFSLLVFAYVVCERYAASWMAVVLVALLSFNFRELILATSLLSEPPYAVLSVMTLWLAERYLQTGRGWLKLALPVMLILSFLTRLSGLALLIALVLHLRRDRAVSKNLVIIVPAIVAVVCWLVWCRLNSDTGGSQLSSYYTSYFDDWKNAVILGAQQTGQSYFAALSLLILRNVLMSAVASTSLMILGLSYNGLPKLWDFPVGLFAVLLAFLILLLGFLRRYLARPRLLHTYALIYLGLHLLWPYTAYDRFLMPILPFILLFFLDGSSDLFKSLTASAGSPAWKSPSGMAIVACVAVLLGFLFIADNYVSGVKQQLEHVKLASSEFAEAEVPLYRWVVQNTKPTDVLMAYQDPKCFLFTERRAIRMMLRTTGDSVGDEIARAIRAAGVDYLIMTPTDFLMEGRGEELRHAVQRYLMDRPGNFVPVFRTERGDSRIYRVVGIN